MDNKMTNIEERRADVSFIAYVKDTVENTFPEMKCDFDEDYSTVNVFLGKTKVYSNNLDNVYHGWLEDNFYLINVLQDI